jgi:hypothetical protein
VALLVAWKTRYQQTQGWSGPAAFAHDAVQTGPVTDELEVRSTPFAKLGRDRIAYQVLGEGLVDLVLAPAMGDAVDIRLDRNCRSTRNFERPLVVLAAFVRWAYV